MWQVVLLAVLSVACANPVSHYGATTERINTMKSYMPIGALSNVDEKMRTKCLKYNNIAAYHNFTAAVNNCMVEIQYASLMEMAAAVRRSEEMTNIKLFCRLTPQIVGCVNNIVDAIEPCMTPQERDMKEFAANSTEALLDYICYNEGERIINFVEEGGLECMEAKKMQINQCANTTLSKYVEEDSSENSLEPVEVRSTEDKCRDEFDTQKCMIDQMKECSSTQPAMFMNGLINSMLDATPCAKYRHGTLGVEYV